MPGSESLTSDNLQDGCECNTSQVQEMPDACSNNSIENSCTFHGETASVGADATEIIDHTSPPPSGDLKYDVKSDADGAADVESLHSVDFIESDHISSSLIDSSLSHYQPSESLSSTPEHVISAKMPFSTHALNCTSDGSEAHVADELPQPVAEPDVSVDVADVQSPDHKRTRRHARKDGTPTKRKQRRAVGKVESDNAVDLQHDYYSKPSDIQSTSQPEQLEFSAYQSHHSDGTQHLDEIPDAVEPDDLAAQVLRHASYLKAVGIGSKKTVTSRQPSKSTNVAESTGAQASKDHLSSHESAKPDSK